MPGVKKRKTGKGAREVEKYAKKLKSADSNAKWVKDAQTDGATEFAFDSDPLEETPTPEQSGEDNGVSWPSDDELDEPAEAGGVILPPVEMHMRTAPRESSGSKETKTRSQNAAVAIGDSLTSRHTKQRSLTQERKSSKANADVIARAKKIWEKLRLGALPADERKGLIEELFHIITGRVKDLVMKHDAGRIVQSAIKYGSTSQRRTIAEELRGEYRQLAAGKYAKYTIGKLMSNGDEVIRDTIVPELFGSVRSLIKHPEGGWILDDIYRGGATKKQKSRLLREWYGAEFSVFQTEKDSSEDLDLETLLAHAPQKRRPVIGYLFEMINSLVQKRTTGFTMLHDAMLQYYLNIDPRSEEANEFVQLILGDDDGDLLKNLAFTTSGARMVSLIIAHGGAKERKQLIRVYKGHMRTLAFDLNGHQILATALQVIDDTVLTTKVIYGELVPRGDVESEIRLLEQVTHLTARVPLLLPFVHKTATILPPQRKGLFSEIQNIRATSSKKDFLVRSQELARAIAPGLLNLIVQHTTALLESSFGCIFIQEVLLSSPADITERQIALDAIIGLLDPIRLNCLGAEEASKIDKLFNAPAATRMLKNLVYSGYFNPATGAVELCREPIHFAHKLYSAVFKEGTDKKTFLQWATGVRSFVIESMLLTEDLPPRHKEVLRSVLQEQRGDLLRAANDFKEPKLSSIRRVSATAGNSRKTASRRNRSRSMKHEHDDLDAGTRIGGQGAEALLGLLGAVA